MRTPSVGLEMRSWRRFETPADAPAVR